MKQFFNIIAGENECCILLHGEIGYYDCLRSGDIIKELLEATAAYGKINIHINSLGGDVYSGIAIFNAIRNSEADITIYIDGVAASIASVIALCGKPVYMSKYARLMIHGVSGGCYGTKEEIKATLNEIETLEGSLCEMYAKKLQLSPDEIRSQYFDGSDHWLNADEALKLGFIDGVYDADPIPEDSTPEQVYTLFQNKYIQSLNTDNMIFEQLRKRAAFANCTTDDQVLEQIEKMETEAGKVPGLEKENGELKTTVQGYQTKETEAADKAIDAELARAVKEGRINEPQQMTYKALYKADPDNARAAIKALPAKRRVLDNLGAGGDGEETPELGAWDKRQQEIKNNL